MDAWTIEEQDLVCLEGLDFPLGVVDDGNLGLLRDQRIWVTNYLENQFQWRDDGSEPPVLTRKLMALAFLFLIGTTMKDLDLITHWTCDSFSCYDDFDRRLPSFHRVRRKFNQELESMSSPFYDDAGFIRLIEGCRLRQILYEGNEFYPFLRLPAELRILVYKFVFPNVDDNGELVVLNRKEDGIRKQIFNQTKHGIYPAWRGDASSSTLAILSASRQLNSESLPYFYRQNHFVFQSICNMWQCLFGMGKERRKYLLAVTVEYCPISSITADKANAARAFSLLAECQHLKTFGMVIDELRLKHASKKLNGPADFPGFRQLRQFRGLKSVVFRGSFRETEIYLKDEMMKPRT